MSAADFTPGPWWVPKSAPLAINSNPHNIAHAYFVNGEANANLIAAAPEAHVAAAAVVDGWDNAIPQAEMDALVDALRAALAKGRGERVTA